MQRQAGFSLIGILIAMAILMVVLTGGYVALGALSRSWHDARQQDQYRQAVQLAGYMLLHAAQYAPVSMCASAQTFTVPISVKQQHISLRGLQYVSWLPEVKKGVSRIVVPYQKSWKKGTELVLDDCQHVGLFKVVKTQKMRDQVKLTFTPATAVIFHQPTRIGYFQQATFYVGSKGGFYYQDTKGRRHELFSEINHMHFTADTQHGIWVVLQSHRQHAAWVLPR